MYFSAWSIPIVISCYTCSLHHFWTGYSCPVAISTKRWCTHTHAHSHTHARSFTSKQWFPPPSNHATHFSIWMRTPQQNTTIHLHRNARTCLFLCFSMQLRHLIALHSSEQHARPICTHNFTPPWHHTTPHHIVCHVRLLSMFTVMFGWSYLLRANKRPHPASDWNPFPCTACTHVCSIALDDFWALYLIANDRRHRNPIFSSFSPMKKNHPAQEITIVAPLSNKERNTITITATFPEWVIASPSHTLH